jgi:hypothetical protein
MSLGHGASIVRDGLVLHLDAANTKSYSKELVVNGTFDTDISNWTKVAGNAIAARSTSIFPNGSFSLTVSDSIYVAYSQNVPVVPNIQYRVLWQHYATNGNTARVIVWDGDTTTRLIQQYQNSSDSIVTYSFLVTPTQNFLRFFIDAPGNSNGTQHVDNISITSTIWTDLSGNGNNGTLVNGVAYSSDNNGVLVFDGVNDYVDCGSASTLNFGTANFSLCFVTYATAYGFQGGSYVGKGNGTSTGFDFRDSNFLVHGENTGEIAKMPFSATLNVQQHHTFIFNRATSPYITYYRNGLFFSASTTNNSAFISSSVNSTQPFRIALSVAGGLTRYFNGNISLVKAYNRALTAAEVKQNFEAMRGRYGI